MSDEIVLSSAEGIGEILINRPDKLNAMTTAMIDELARLAAEVDRDDSIRVVLLRGAGERAFCAGSDLASVAAYPTAWAFRNRLEHGTVVRAIRKPVVVALKGWVLGGGFEMALSADIRVAGRSAVFGAPEVTRGWVGGGGASQLLPRLIGYGQAMRLLLTGERIDAAEAKSLGIVEYLVNDDEVDGKARDVCRVLAGHSPIATQSVKAAVRTAMSAPLQEGLAHENELTSLCFASGNYQAGAQAFADRSKSTATKSLQKD